MVHNIRGDQKPFTEVMSMALHEGTDTQRIDVVLDVFSRIIRSRPPRERGSKRGHEFGNIKADNKIRNGGNSYPIPEINCSYEVMKGKS